MIELNVLNAWVLAGSAMGAFFTRCKIESSVERNTSAIIPRILVDIGSECIWVPAAILEKIGIKREKQVI